MSARLARLSRSLLLIALVNSATLLGGLSASAGDWPQILGPRRDGRASEDEKLAERWAEEGPAEVWRKPLGSGFAGPAVVGREVYVFHRVGDNERLQRLDRATGREVWRADFDATYRGGINPDNGPRCVPLVHDEHVYVFGAAGDLHCVARCLGTHRWTRATHVEMRADEGYFGAGSTPIAIGESLLVNVGGTPEAGIAAFSLESGETIWQKTRERASYCAPTRTSLDGQDYAIFVTRYNALAIDPASGEVRFRYPFGQRGPTVNAATPLVFDGRMFLSAAYGVGCALIQIDQSRPRTIWSGNDTLSSQYNTAVRHEGHLYGIHGREDVGRAELRCVESERGTIKWTQPDFGVGHLILADGKLLILTVDGTLLLARPDTERFVRLDEARVSVNTTRALPALSNGHFYFRDNRRDSGSLVCLRVGR